MLRIGLQSVRCNCLSKANVYWDGKEAKCPVCGKQHIVEYINGVPDGVISANVMVI
jgi:hypothetical protein